MSILKNIFLWFFPPPKQGFRIGRFVFLIVFLGVYTGICVYLEYRKYMLFTNLWAFSLMLVAPWVWWMNEHGYSGLHGFRSQFALLVRLSLIGVFVMLLAGPRSVRESDILSVVYALDLSDSIGEQAVDKSLKYVVKTAEGRPEKDEAGVIVFGRDAAVELPPRNTFAFDTVYSRISKDGTDLEKGLSLAAAMLPEEQNGRIVLISDGTSTEGKLNVALNELKSKNIVVDVLPVQYHFDNEVWLEKLELPRNVRQGESYEASVVLSSLRSGRGTLMLFENDRPIHKQEVNFKAGKNRYTLPVYLREPGYYEYVAKIVLPQGKDGWKNNNIAINYLYLRGKGKVLLVKDSIGDERDWKSLAKVIRKSERVLEIKDAIDLQRDALSLQPYDCIIFVNVAADAFDAVQLKAVRDAVYNQGTGFLMVGGANSFGPGGFHRTPIEEILPVNMDITNKKVLPKGALAIILHTCEFPNGNTWAKRIAKAAIKVMGKQDEAGVLAWDWNKGEQWVFPLMPVSKYEEMVKKINNCNPGDMPSFVGTMKMALNALIKSDAAVKHVIIISDGDPQCPSPALVKKYSSNQVSVTTVLVDGFHQGSFQGVMRSIAKSTGGRFYYVKDPNALPSIFIKEAKTLKKSMIQNKTFTPRVEFQDGTVLKGVGDFKPLHGYVLTSAKGDPRRCRVILRGPDQDQLDPLLAVGMFGVGKSAAFTSDLSTNWAREWMSWPELMPFVKQLIISISRVSGESNLKLNTYASGNRGVIVVEDFHPRETLLEIVARIDGPRNKSLEINLDQVGPRRYQADFDLWGKGRYQVVAVAGEEERRERVVGGFVIPYSAEYLRFRSNSLVLNHIVDATGGRMLTGDEDGKQIFLQEREKRYATRAVFDIFLLILAILIPLDVAVRRVQIDYYVIKGWFGLGGDKKESTRTLGALLRRKKTVKSQADEQKQESREFLSHQKVARRAKKSKPDTPDKIITEKPVEPETKSQEDEKVDGDEPSTTGRLLAMKRKRKDK